MTMLAAAKRRTVVLMELTPIANISDSLCMQIAKKTGTSVPVLQYPYCVALEVTVSVHVCVCVRGGGGGDIVN